MKKLTLVRHAKSDWGNEGLEDLMRPLNETGYLDARLVAKQVQKKMSSPDYWISSPAIRAFSTALIFAQVFKYDTDKIMVRKKIYASSLKTLKQIIKEAPDSCQHLILFGHNPEITTLFNDISSLFADNIPTCGTMHLVSETKKWSDFLTQPLKNDFYIYPKEFKQ